MFDVGNAEDTNGGALPPSIYPVFVEKVEWKMSQSGSEYLNVMFRVFGEKCNNAVIFSMYNVLNKNETAQKIAMSEIKKMLTACGYTKEQMSFASKEALAEAISKVRCRVKTAIKTDDYGDKTVIKGYEKLEESLPMPNAAPAFAAGNIPF